MHASAENCLQNSNLFRNNGEKLREEVGKLQKEKKELGEKLTRLRKCNQKIEQENVNRCKAKVREREQSRESNRKSCEEEKVGFPSIIFIQKLVSLSYIQY